MRRLTVVAFLLGSVACWGTEEPVCGENAQQCPTGSYSVAWSDTRPGEDASRANSPILEADVGYLNYNDGECRYTCETVAECPGWTWPVFTESCSYCATAGPSGEPVRLGGASGNDCDGATHPGFGRIDHDKTVIVGSRAQGIVTGGELVGVEQIWFEEADGRNLCTVSHDLVTLRTGVCSQCDFSFEVELTNGRAIGDKCDELGLSGGETDGARLSMGYKDLLQIDDRSYEHVLFWDIGGNFLPYYYAQWDSADGHFSFEKVWGAW